jgi:hypothetical protein
MQCLQCQSENASDAKFCNQCAVPFAPVCPTCGRENAADARFCNQCGTPLVASLSTFSSSASHRREIPLESRLYTVLPFVISLLQRERRVTYRMLKHVYGVDDGLLEEIREELLLRHLASAEGEKVLIWTGEHRWARRPSSCRRSGVYGGSIASEGYYRRRASCRTTLSGPGVAASLFFAHTGAFLAFTNMTEDCT